MIEVLKVDEWSIRRNPKFKLIREFAIQRIKDDKIFSIDDLIMIDEDLGYYQLEYHRIVGFSKNNKDIYVVSHASQFEIRIDVDLIFHIGQTPSRLKQQNL